MGFADYQPHARWGSRSTVGLKDRVLIYNPNERGAVENALARVQDDLDRLPKIMYADVQFPGAYRSWTYEIPEGWADTVRKGSYVSVDRGVYAGQKGVVTQVHDRRPDCPYVYKVNELHVLTRIA